MAALQRAVALSEVDGLALAVAEHLELDVARPGEVFFKIDSVVAEGVLASILAVLSAVGQFVRGGSRPSCRALRRRPPP